MRHRGRPLSNTSKSRWEIGFSGSSASQFVIYRSTYSANAYDGLSVDENDHRPGLHGMRMPPESLRTVLLDEILRAIRKCIDDAFPVVPLLNPEVQRLPIRIDHCVNVMIALRGAVQAKRKSVRFPGKVDGAFHAIPTDVFAPKG